MDLLLTDKKAIVLGASRGIGKATVELLLNEGCHVACCARNEVDVSNWHGGEKAQDRLRFTAIDMQDRSALSDWVRAQADALGGLDIIIGNASALASGTDAAAWQANLDIDVLALQTAIEAALPYLEQTASKGNDAAIVALSSVSASLTQSPRPYGSIKAAQVHYIKSLAHELAPRGIRANTVSPGTIYFEDGVWGQVERDDPDAFQHAIGRNPTGRMGSPREIANAVVFLASPAASFVYGANLVVDGALTTQLML